MVVLATASRLRAKGLVPNPDEKALLQQVTYLRGKGSSYRQIASELTKAGLKPRLGGEWNPNQVRRIAQKYGVE